MVFNYNKYKFNSKDFEVFCGADVSKKSMAVTFIKPDGEIKSLKFAYDSGTSFVPGACNVTPQARRNGERV